MSDHDAPPLSEGLPLVAVINAAPRPTALDRPVTCGYEWKCNRPLAADGLEMRLQGHELHFDDHLNARRRRSEVVVRGGVEPPTFRFSGVAYAEVALVVRVLCVVGDRCW